MSAEARFGCRGRFCGSLTRSQSCLLRGSFCGYAGEGGGGSHLCEVEQGLCDCLCAFNLDLRSHLYVEGVKAPRCREVWRASAGISLASISSERFLASTCALKVS